MNIAMAGKKKIREGDRGRVLYTIREEKVTDDDLKNIFPKEYEELKNLKKREKSFLGLFDDNNYVHKYFFTVHNEKYDCKVRPGKVVGFKAEKKGNENIMKANVEYPNGKVEENSLKIFPGVELTDINLNKYVLVHNEKVCQEISEKEYLKIVNEYM
ncbi:MAG: hypothetical protein ACOCTT_03355 [archaeon]